MSFYGGIFSVLPAYIADLYGQKHAGAIHGAALTAWAASAVCGPMGLARLRAHAEQSAIGDLLGKVCTVRDTTCHTRSKDLAASPRPVALTTCLSRGFRCWWALANSATLWAGSGYDSFHSFW